MVTNGFIIRSFVRSYDLELNQLIKSLLVDSYCCRCIYSSNILSYSSIKVESEKPYPTNIWNWLLLGSPVNIWNWFDQLGFDLISFVGSQGLNELLAILAIMIRHVRLSLA